MDQRSYCHENKVKYLIKPDILAQQEAFPVKVKRPQKEKQDKNDFDTKKAFPISTETNRKERNQNIKNDKSKGYHKCGRNRRNFLHVKFPAESKETMHRAISEFFHGTDNRLQLLFLTVSGL